VSIGFVKLCGADQTHFNTVTIIIIIIIIIIVIMQRLTRHVSVMRMTNRSNNDGR